MKIRAWLADQIRRIANRIDGGPVLHIGPVDDKTIWMEGSVPCGTMHIHGGVAMKAGATLSFGSGMASYEYHESKAEDEHD